MDTSDKEKANDQTSYNISGIHSDWQCNTPSLRPVCGTPPVYSTHQEDHLGAGACPSSSMVSSFSNCPWNTANATDLRLSESNVPLDSLSGGNFLQNGYDLSANLSADSSFIQRSAHFSGFHAGSFGAMMNPFSTTQLVNPCSSAASDLERARLHKSEVSMAEALKNEPFHTAGDPTEDQKKVSLHASVTMSNRSSEHDTTGGARQEAIDNSSPKELAAKKRKKTNDDPVLNQVQGASQMASETTEAKKNVEPESSSAPTVNSNGKEIKEAPEAPKTDYIHIRARRGQATNSHSLAERLRREKISERMKFLQNLVPGCSKVTGKAVMLDEIINYVQSLQRQVEFLSMKLATVNPNLDINIETLLSKDLLQSRAGHPSGMSFPLDVIHPQLSLSQQGLAHPGTSGILNPSDLLLRSLNPQMTSLDGYKERAQQMPTSWDEEIRNVMQMSYDSNPTLNL